MDAAHSATVIAFERDLESKVEGMPQEFGSKNPECCVDQLHLGFQTPLSHGFHGIEPANQLVIGNLLRLWGTPIIL